MTKVTIDSTLSSALCHLPGPVELCDESGRILGQFIPQDDPLRWEPISPEVSNQELDRRESETDSLTTAEMLSHLESLRCSKSSGSDRP